MKVQYYTASPISFRADTKQNDNLLPPQEVAKIVRKGINTRNKREDIRSTIREFKNQQLSPQEIDKLGRRIDSWEKVIVSPENWKGVIALPDNMFKKEEMDSFHRKIAKFPDKGWFSYEEGLNLYEADEKYVDHFVKHSSYLDPGSAMYFSKRFKETDDVLKRTPENIFKKDLIKANEHLRKHYFTHDTGRVYNHSILTNIVLQNEKIKDVIVKAEILSKLDDFNNSEFNPVGESGRSGINDPLQNPELQEILIIQDIVNQANKVYTTISRDYPIRTLDGFWSNKLPKEFDYRNSVQKIAEERVKEINRQAQKNGILGTDFKT